MKKNAWTLAEMVIALLVLIVILTFTTTATKNINTSKAKFYTYGAIKNLQEAQAGIIEKYGAFYPEVAQDHDNVPTNSDWYCLNVADLFSTDTAFGVNCSTTNIDTANFKIQSGVTFYGMATPWIDAPDGLKFQYKNIMIDIDGDKGKNKLLVDRFLYRVFRGESVSGTNIEGLVYPTCGDYDKIYKKDGNLLNMINPYCKPNNDFVFQGGANTYDIYRADGSNDGTTAKMMLSNLPILQAECKAYGGTGYYDKAACTQASIELDEQCAYETICKQCIGSNYNVCPEGTMQKCLDHAKENNPFEYSCFIVEHRPTGALGIFSSAILGDLDI